MRDLFPGYDVLAKRSTPSWNQPTRDAVDRRLAIDPTVHRFFNDSEWQTLCAICIQVVPQPQDRARPVPLAAMVDKKMHENRGDGFYDARLGPMQEAWRRGLAALDNEAISAHGVRFPALTSDQQKSLLSALQSGELEHPSWGGMPPQLFFAQRVLDDIVCAYYVHPIAWNEIGWGGRQVRAVTYAWISIGETRGKQRKRSQARAMLPTAPISASVAGACARTGPRREILFMNRAHAKAALRMFSTAAPGCRCGNTATPMKSILSLSVPAPEAARWLVLHDKGILSIDEARNILMLALHQTRVYGSTVEGVEAQRIIEDMLSNRFSARRE